MARLRPASFVVLLFLVAGVAAGAQPPRADAPGLTLPEYLAELEHWAGVVERMEAGKPADPEERALPAEWRVQWDGQEAVVSTAWLKSGMEIIQKNPARGEELRRQLRARLERLRAEGAALQERESGRDLGEARRHLEDILSRREFSRVRGQSWLDILRMRINEWLAELLGKIFRGLGAHPTVGDILLWLCIAVLLCILAIWLKRLRLPAEPEAGFGPEAPPAARDWSEWAREAAVAASRGEYRKAILLAYWACIHRLENLGAWTPDRSRTPREYVRLLPPQDSRHSPLAALTRRFEAVWYGGQPATPDDFHDVIQKAELLGCLFNWTPATEKS